MNNPVRAYERSEWRSAGYRHQPCSIVWKTGVCNFRVFQTPVSVGGWQPRTSCLRHSYGVTLFRGMKPLNPCSARLSLYRQKNKRDKRISHINNMSLCSYVLITIHTHANLFSPYVFRMENIGGVAVSRGGWRIAPYVGMSINPFPLRPFVYRPSCSHSA